MWKSEGSETLSGIGYSPWPASATTSSRAMSTPSVARFCRSAAWLEWASSGWKVVVLPPNVGAFRSRKNMKNSNDTAPGAISRRTLLAGGIAAGSLPVLLATKANATVKVSQAAVHFETVADGGHNCGACRHFLAPSSCRFVEGTVSSAVRAGSGPARSSSTDYSTHRACAAWADAEKHGPAAGRLLSGRCPPFGHHLLPAHLRRLPRRGRARYFTRLVGLRLRRLRGLSRQ